MWVACSGQFGGRGRVGTNMRVNGRRIRWKASALCGISLDGGRREKLSTDLGWDQK